MNNLGTTIGYLNEYFDNDPDILKIMVALAIPLDLDDAIAWTIIGALKPEADNNLLCKIKSLDIVYKQRDTNFYFEKEARAELLSLVHSELDEEFRQKIHKLLLLSYQQKLENFTENYQVSLYFRNCLKIKIGYHLVWLNRSEEASQVWQSILDGFADEQSKIYVQAAISFITLEHEVLTNLMARLSEARAHIGQH